MAVLIDEFLENAVEIDVDAVSDGRATIIAGIMEHIEQAGIHSGDSTCVLPCQSIPFKIIEEIRHATNELARELKVVGLMNIQFALKDGLLYILEVNPRASRTIPFVSKATGVPWARIAAQVMCGKTLSELGISPRLLPPHVSVKSVVIPFKRFHGAQISLGPEMRSTGEVMGIASQFGLAFAKAQIAAGQQLCRLKGTHLYQCQRQPQARCWCRLPKIFISLGFELIATRGTAQVIKAAGIPAMVTNKVSEGRPNLVDRIKNGEINLVINIPSGRTARGRRPAHPPRRHQLQRTRCHPPWPAPVPTLSAIAALQSGSLGVKSLQEYHQNIATSEKTGQPRKVRY